MSSKKWLARIGALAVLAAVFITVSYIARANETLLAGVIQGGSVLSSIGFTLLTAIFVIFVIPLDIVFLIPLGALVWGPIPTALMSITGWVLGSMAAFLVARLLGASVVEKLVGLRRIREIETRIPKRNLFWTVVFLRLSISVDILSYALGLFSTIEWKPYALATLIGVAPFGFYFSYAGTLPFWYQIAAMGGAVALAAIMLLTQVRNPHDANKNTPASDAALPEAKKRPPRPAHTRL